MRIRLPVGPSSWIVLASRIAHGVISLLFLSCIAAIYLGAWAGKADAVTIAALAALCVEGGLVILSRGTCPLGPMLRRLGDEKPFFELFLPPRAAKLAVLSRNSFAASLPVRQPSILPGSPPKLHTYDHP